MTREKFFDWVQAREERYEFDGFRPVAMTGGTINHNRIAFNLHRSRYTRRQGTGCEALGQDAGVATIGDAVDKVGEYRAVPSIRRCVILEHTSIGLTVLTRADADMDWTATTLTAGKTVDMPEIGIAIPINEFYEGTDLPATEQVTT